MGRDGIEAFSWTLDASSTCTSTASKPKKTTDNLKVLLDQFSQKPRKSKDACLHLLIKSVGQHFGAADLMLRRNNTNLDGYR